MDLPLDVWRSIILTLKINYIENLNSVDKFFQCLCCERNLWSTKFKEKNLDIINSEINTVGHYKKVSYTSYTTDHLLGMVINNKYNPQMWYTNDPISVKDLENILTKDHPIFIKIKENNYMKRYIDITIGIKEKILICDLFTGDGYNRINLWKENYANEKFMRSLIIKILYYCPLINFTDVDSVPLIISDKLIFDYNLLNFYSGRINSRKEYWHGCYSKYEELYY
jgi:hypothetical protein